MGLDINTRTTGFGSPAEGHVDRRLDLNDLLITDHTATFFFRWAGPDKGPVKTGDMLVVDRSALPAEGDLVVVTRDGAITLDRHVPGDPGLWGQVMWSLTRVAREAGMV
jgi:DNA polymerase V